MMSSTSIHTAKSINRFQPSSKPSRHSAPLCSSNSNSIQAYRAIVHSIQSFLMFVVDKTDSIQILGDIAYVSVGGVLPDANHFYYHFNLNFVTLGPKVCLHH